ncbi:MAG: hypothetical protein EA343_11640 [Nodularia sp. (in: Bacteria)]|nr:MAG: hypothetical protein EA343_11640 [Nodularia sp. (in: cyanobacteria)]
MLHFTDSKNHYITTPKIRSKHFSAYKVISFFFFFLLPPSSFSQRETLAPTWFVPLTDIFR